MATLTLTQEAYNDALQFRREARHLFRLGILSLAEAVLAEDLHMAVKQQALQVPTATCKPYSLYPKSCLTPSPKRGVFIEK